MGEEGDDRLSIRQALLVWGAAAVTGWALTVGALWLATQAF
jgi:hypothetical protein